MRVQKAIAIFFSCIILSGCATSSSIITGNARPAIPVTEVKIYLDPSSQYESIGIIESSSDVVFSTQSAQD